MPPRSSGDAGPLLAVSAVAPWPVRDGYSLRVSHLLSRLGRERPVTLVSPEPSDGDLEREEGAGAPEAIRWVRAEGIPATTALPWAPERERFVEVVRDAAADRRFRAALVWAGAEFVAHEIRSLPPAVVDRIDCESLQLWRRRRYYGSWRKKLQEVRRDLETLLYERRVVRAFDTVVVTSPADARALGRLSGHDRIEVLPNGVEVPDEPALPSERETPSLVFTGVLEYAPNVDAVRWFVDRVWPRVRAAVPEAVFVIAGRSPIPDVTALGEEPGVELRPDVPDVRSEIRRAWAAVAPMRSGSGIKNKVLEAWSVARPVLLTELAAEGLALPAALEGSVCAGSEEMAAKAVDLLRTPELRRRLGEAGRRHVSSRFSWDTAAERLRELVRAAEDRAAFR